MCLLRNSFWVDDFLKHVNHVIELPMDVTYDDDWLLDLEEIGFLLYGYQTRLRNVFMTVQYSKRILLVLIGEAYF